MRAKNADRNNLRYFINNPEKYRRQHAEATARWREKQKLAGVKIETHANRDPNQRRELDNERKFRWTHRRKGRPQGLAIVGYMNMENPLFSFVYKNRRHRESLREPLPTW